MALAPPITVVYHLWVRHEEFAANQVELEVTAVYPPAYHSLEYYLNQEE
jgi:hypothetical protein